MHGKGWGFTFLSEGDVPLAGLQAEGLQILIQVSREVMGSAKLKAVLFSHLQNDFVG